MTHQRHPSQKKAVFAVNALHEFFLGLPNLESARLSIREADAMIGDGQSLLNAVIRAWAGVAHAIDCRSVVQ